MPPLYRLGWTPYVDVVVVDENMLTESTQGGIGAHHGHLGLTDAVLFERYVHGEAATGRRIDKNIPHVGQHRLDVDEYLDRTEEGGDVVALVERKPNMDVLINWVLAQGTMGTPSRLGS